ncbi:hypothetical protein ACVWYN_002518 [Pedobacter sp. UYP24]
MKRPLFLFLLSIILPLLIQAQSGITFKVEELEKPKQLLKLSSYKDIYNEPILNGIDFQIRRELLKANQDPYQIIARSKGPDQLVNFGDHSFFSGMYQAYANHRPFVLSPDIMWLLIEQGFARHVNNNAEKLRKYFVTHEGKTSLVLNSQNIKLDDPNAPWEAEVFPAFANQISAAAGSELTKAMTSDFTTSTPTTRATSQITLMEAVKPFFDYVIVYFSCGIPEITVEGTPADWQKVLDKANYLKKYELAWWINEINPILKEFLNASNGKVDKDFWRNMFKYHSIKQYGAKELIDGWIVKFYPYYDNGNRSDFKGFNSTRFLPSEMVKVDVAYNDVTPNGETITTPLEVWAGFTGLTQDENTFTLKPQIGWMVRKKDPKLYPNLAAQLKESDGGFGGVHIRVNTVPKEILELTNIKSLSLDFMGDILIPEEMGKISIENLNLKGTITQEEAKRIATLFPNTFLTINRVQFSPIAK